MVEGTETDSDLALRAAAGCRSAFSVLLDRHYDRIYSLAWRWTGRRDRAEDIAQDVCVKLAVAISGWRGEAAVSTWIYRITYTTTVDHLRAAQRVCPLPPSQVAALVETCAADGTDEADASAEIWQAVRELPDQQRDAVLLVYGQDFSHQQAAELMGCREKTVSWHLHEARKRLKLKLEAVG